jgi:prevent-host-death family protein
MTKTLPITQARECLRSLVERASRRMARFIITRKGKPDAVLMSHAEYQSWMETFEVMADREEMESIREGIAALVGGQAESYEDVFGEPLGGPPAEKRKALTASR